MTRRAHDATAAPVADVPVAPHLPGHTVASLPLAGHAIETGVMPYGSVAVLDKPHSVLDRVEILDIAEASVVPPRSFAGWTDENGTESTATLVGLPLATLPRERRRNPADPLPDDTLRRSSDARTRSHLAQAPAATKHQSTRPGEPRAVTAHTLPTRTGVGANGAMTGHARRSVSRSADGRHVQWTAGHAVFGVLADAASTLDDSTSIGSSVARSLAPAMRPDVAKAAPAIEPGTVAAERPGVQTVSRSLLDEIEIAAGRSTEASAGDSHILRRALLAANEMSAALGDLAVSPPPAIGLAIETGANVTMDPAGSTPTVRRTSVAAATPGAPPPGASGTWVPPGPGTLFSVLSGSGVLPRRALLTMPDVLRRATLMQAASARPGPSSSALGDDPTVRPGVYVPGPVTTEPAAVDALSPRHASLAASEPAGVVHAIGAVAGTTTGHEGAVAASTVGEPLERRGTNEFLPATTRSHSATNPALEFDDLTVAPRSVRRTLVDDTVEPMVDSDSLAVAPRSVQRFVDASTGDEAVAADQAAATSAMSAAHPATTSTSGRPDPTSGAARLAAVDLADRFLAELSRHRQERPKPLPTQFASIADLIVGRRTPLVSTGEASQRALAAVDKVAATTGDVIHIADPHRLVSPDAEMREIIAHELTHVAAPSAAPRFFNDDRHSTEEQRASEIGQLMRRSPAPPTGSGIARGASTPMSSTQTTHWSGSPSSGQTPSRSGSASSGAGVSSDTIRRSLDTSSTPTIRRAVAIDELQVSPSSGSPSEPAAKPTMSPQEFEGLLRDNFDLIVELLEDRILSDIERRGGRYRGDF